MRADGADRPFDAVGLSGIKDVPVPRGVGNTAGERIGVARLVAVRPCRGVIGDLLILRDFPDQISLCPHVVSKPLRKALFQPRTVQTVAEQRFSRGIPPVAADLPIGPVREGFFVPRAVQRTRSDTELSGNVGIEAGIHGGSDVIAHKAHTLGERGEKLRRTIGKRVGKRKIL